MNTDHQILTLNAKFAAALAAREIALDDLPTAMSLDDEVQAIEVATAPVEALAREIVILTPGAPAARAVHAAANAWLQAIH